jgi:anti-anti-sigma regulatory factor
MLKITEYRENNNTLRLRLDGTISQTSLADLENACSEHRASREIILDMGGVVFMNNEVASRIVRLRSEHLRIINCSPFIETLLNTVEA